MAYQPLAALLGPDQPLYGLQSRALVSTIQEYDRLDDMAAAYAASIRQQQPTGPYYLLGWSLGGILAMTVAKVLEQQGQGVAFVGLLDTRLPKNDDLSWGHDPLLGLLVAFGGTMAAALAALAPVEQQALREELVALPPMERLQRLTAWGRERRLLTSDVPLATLQRQAALAEVHVALWQTQKTTPMQAPLFVWWARQSLREGKPPTDWKRYALGNMSTDIVEGNHFSIMQSPHVHLLAARLRACLRTAQEEMVPVASKRLPNIHRGGEC